MPESPLLQALHRGDKEQLLLLYEQEAAGRMPLEVWRDASDHGRHDLQHAVIALYPHHGIELKLASTRRKASNDGSPKPLNGELHRPLGTDAHDSLIRHVKQFPYFSEKPERLTDANLNGEVPFADGGYRGHHTILCRHLASTWALQVLAGGKPDYSAFRDEAALQRCVPSSAQPLYERLLTAAQENHLVPMANWGRFLALQLQALATGGGEMAQKVMLFSSSSHVMAVQLKVKQDAEGLRCVANFYDPNLTAGHKRVASGDPQRFEALRMDQVFSSHSAAKEIFGNESVVSVTTVPSGGEAMLPRSTPGGDPERRITGQLPVLDECVLHLLMAGGFAGTLRDLGPQLAESAKKSPFMTSMLLAGRAADIPGLFAAAMAGQAEVFRAVRPLLELMSPDRQAWLLAAKPSGNISAMRCAAASNDAETVSAIIECAAACKLVPEEQLKLLAAKPSEKASPVLAIAAGAGYLDTVSAYLNGLASHASLSAQVKVELLSMGDDAGRTAMTHGMLEGTPETVAALTGWIAHQAFSDDDRRKLLLAPDREGTPALVHALRNGAADNVRAYVKAVLESPMDEADKLHVLAPGRASAGPGDRASSALAAFLAEVRDSVLGPAAKEQLTG